MTTMLTTKLITTLLAGALLAACTTSGKKTAGEGDLAKSTGESVVQQQGRTEPVVSQHERKYWLDMRQSKGILPRIDGALATGEATAALDLARGYLAKHPGEPRAMMALSAALVMNRSYDLAAYYAGLVEKQQPGNAAALNVKGMAAMLTPKARLADFQKAIGFFQAALDADATHVAAGLNLGSLYLELGNAKAAGEVFAKTVQRCDDCTAALMGHGIAMARSQQKEKAVKSFEAVLARHGRHTGAMYQLALVYKNGYNDRKKAEKYLFQILAEKSPADQYAKERAQTVLRVLKGEASSEERTMIAEDEGETAPAAAKEDKNDAELLMTGSEFD